MFFKNQVCLLLIILVLFSLATAETKREPHIGYIYPAGAQQGQTINIVLGGQYLRGPQEVYITGVGIRVSVIEYAPGLRNLDKDQRQELRSRMEAVRNKRMAELGIELEKIKRLSKRPQKKGAPKNANGQDEKNTKAEDVKLPNNPLWYDLENKSLRELAHIRHMLFDPKRRRQQNRQIAETVLVEITVDPNARPGRRELRLLTAGGLTNPMVFEVGTLPEITELEPNNDVDSPKLPNVPKDKPVKLPVVLNGQIMPGDIDHFHFQAAKGQKLVIETHARSLIPYLADAVPGWFQAVVTLYDSNGKEIAFMDDYRFHPDPVLFYEIPKTGEYKLEIRDSIFRGREDFVYRIGISEKPFITELFPLGGKTGTQTNAFISGWNLNETLIALDTQAGPSPIRKAVYHQESKFSNAVPYRVDTLAECEEKESNNEPNNAQAVTLPIIVNGRISRRGDTDIFRFSGKAGQKIVAEVYARQLNSPLDSLLRIADANGNTIQFNDDYVVKDQYLHKDTTGLVTHHADSYISAELPADGNYYVYLSDSQNHGGRAYAYRLRLSAPRPDFELRVTPSSLSVRRGTAAAIGVHVLRKDGFNGEIDLVLKKPKTGFKLYGGKIPADRDYIRMTLAAAENAPQRITAVEIEGRAAIDGQTVTHTAVGAEDMMQAFLYRHLVPANELVVSVPKQKWRGPTLEIDQSLPVRIPLGGSEKVRVNVSNRRILKDIKLQLDNAPAGINLEHTQILKDGIVFELAADKDILKSGFTENLIVDVFREFTPKKTKDKGPKKRSVFLGTLPAIAVEIVK